MIVCESLYVYVQFTCVDVNSELSVFIIDMQNTKTPSGDFSVQKVDVTQKPIIMSYNARGLKQSSRFVWYFYLQRFTAFLTISRQVAHIRQV